LSLQEAGHDVVVIDNLVNSGEESLWRVAELSGKAAEFHYADQVDEAAVEAVCAAGGIDAVIHFAGLKAVGESVRGGRKTTHWVTTPEAAGNHLSTPHGSGTSRQRLPRR
jgi:UDP-glucose 4-epimerase